MTPCVRVCGSYSDMTAGTPAEALVDFTGGVHICVQLSAPPPNLWELMYRAGKSRSLMGCGTPQGVSTIFNTFFFEKYSILTSDTTLESGKIVYTLSSLISFPVESEIGSSLIGLVLAKLF